jgi:hypothetical protein
VANLIAPDFIDFGGSDEPKTIAIVVAAADIMPGGPPAILTQTVLMFPSFDQLAATPGAGYSQ